MSEDLREKIEAIFHSYVPKEDKNMRLALAHTMLNGGTLELDFTNLITEIAEFVESERNRYAIEQLDDLLSVMGSVNFMKSGFDIATRNALCAELVTKVVALRGYNQPN